MSVTINIPTSLRSLLPLLQALEQVINNKVPTNGCSYSITSTELVASLGKSQLSINKEVARKLKDNRSRRQRAHLFRELPVVLFGLFSLAREDYNAKRLIGGKLVLNKLKPDGSFTKPRRLLKALGKNPDDERQLDIAIDCLKLLESLNFSFFIKKKKYIVQSFISYEKAINEGKAYAVCVINSTLFNLSIKKHFTKVPIQLISSGNTRATLAGFCVLAEKHYKKTKTVIGYCLTRLCRDASLLQKERRGVAREKSYLDRVLTVLKELNIFKQVCIQDKKIAFTFTETAQNTASQVETSLRKLLELITPQSKAQLITLLTPSTG